MLYLFTTLGPLSAASWLAQALAGDLGPTEQEAFSDAVDGLRDKFGPDLDASAVLSLITRDCARVGRKTRVVSMPTVRAARNHWHLALGTRAAHFPH